MAKKALGKGIGAIISTSPTPVDDMLNGVRENVDRIVELDVNKIIPNPDQPRLHFDESEIKGLADSIKSVGLIQPIIVRKVKNDFVIVAGERRLRAVKLTGKKKVKVIIIEADEEKNLTMSLIENIQREDLDPIEEAKAYRVLVDRFKLKQQDIAGSVGKERATISNSLRLLNLPKEIQDGISEKLISTGHAKVLLSLTGKSEQISHYKKIISKGLSVRALENIINEDKMEKDPDKKNEPKKNPHIKQMEDKLISVLGTKVEIKHSGDKGKIEINYYSLDDFDRIIDLLK